MAERGGSVAGIAAGALDPWMQGMVAGNKVHHAHKDTDWPSRDAKRIAFWLYVGLLGGEAGISKAADIAAFADGAACVQP